MKRTPSAVSATTIIWHTITPTDEGDFSIGAGLGDKAVNAEARATLCVMKNLRSRDKTRYAQRERDREREAQEGNSYK